MMTDSVYETIERGQIWYISNDPTAVGSEQRGTRPGIIVSNNACNKYSQTVEVVYITSKNKKKLPTHAEISNFKVKGIALCEQVHSVDISRLGDHLTFLNEVQMAKVDKCLKVSLALIDKKGQLIEQPNEQPVTPTTDKFNLEGDYELFNAASEYISNLISKCNEWKAVHDQIQQIKNSDINILGIDDELLSEERKEAIKKILSEDLTNSSTLLYNEASSLIQWQGHSVPEVVNASAISIVEDTYAEPNNLEVPYQDKTIEEDQEAEEEAVTENERSPRKMDPKEMTELRDSGLSIEQIAEEFQMQDVPNYKNRISQAIYRYRKEQCNEQGTEKLRE